MEVAAVASVKDIHKARVECHQISPMVILLVVPLLIWCLSPRECEDDPEERVQW